MAANAGFQMNDSFRPWLYGLQRYEYGWLLPLMGHLPYAWARVLSDWRGAWNANESRDWTELAVGFRYLADRANKGYQEVLGSCTPAQAASLVKQRYQMIAREEYEGQLAINGSLLTKLQLDIEPLQRMLAKRRSGRGLVVVMPHLDNLFVGLVGLARCGVAVNLMTSDVVQDPRVHPALRVFFAKKYASYEALMSGGRFMPVSTAGRRHFLASLGRSEIVAVMSDAPASPEGPGTWVQWFGKERKMANSALRMALETGSELVAVACWQREPGQVAWVCSDIEDPSIDCPADGDVGSEVYGRLFAFIEGAIRQAPGSWWAAHLLQDFEVRHDAN